ncbi:MAG: hypothetical protein NC218_08000 [Acetobacter sp.]|nr:hypothetical protein [Acetobacter sp.]
MEKQTSLASVNNANINIDAQLVMIFNNPSEISEKKIANVKALLEEKVRECPELEEPIASILEMLGY